MTKLDKDEYHSIFYTGQRSCVDFDGASFGTNVLKLTPYEPTFEPNEKITGEQDSKVIGAIQEANRRHNQGVIFLKLDDLTIEDTTRPGDNAAFNNYLKSLSSPTRVFESRILGNPIDREHVKEAIDYLPYLRRPFLILDARDIFYNEDMQEIYARGTHYVLPTHMNPGVCYYLYAEDGRYGRAVSLFVANNFRFTLPTANLSTVKDFKLVTKFSRVEDNVRKPYFDISSITPSVYGRGDHFECSMTVEKLKAPLYKIMRYCGLSETPTPEEAIAARLDFNQTSILVTGSLK